MATNTQTVSNANDTLARRRQANTSLFMRRQQEVYAKLPQIEDMGYEITALGVDFTMAKLAKNEDGAAKIKQQMLDLEQQKKHLLIENGFSADYLDPIYTCTICKDKGFVNGKICSCLKQEIVKQRQNMLTSLSPAPKTTFEEFSLDYYPERWEIPLYHEYFSRMNKVNEDSNYHYGEYDFFQIELIRTIKIIFRNMKEKGLI